ncbi:hydrogenase-4 component G [Campylobacter concisus]|uniref:hydrogenase-4 component G n=1 Tax=Campylobacter concisus TaxID=199 RepID=UPI00122C648D|nr:hydrogenase-4 component G [Campylobacter concisus]
MQISQIVSSYNTSSVKENVKSEISLHKDEKEVSKKQPEISSNLSAKEISNSYFLQYQKEITQSASSNLLAQGALGFNVPENLSDILSGLDLASIGYNGKALGELSSDEASELVSENGFFGIANTADRIAGFVLNGAGDDIEKLKAGREGVAKGFEDAKKIWGGELPEISQKTIEKTLETLDKKIAELGGNVLNVSA